MEGEQLEMGRSASPIHDGVGPNLDGSIPPLSWILVLMVWFIMPIIDVIGPQDVLDLVGGVLLG